jgi:hypothetical protein
MRIEIDDRDLRDPVAISALRAMLDGVDNAAIHRTADLDMKPKEPKPEKAVKQMTWEEVFQTLTPQTQNLLHIIALHDKTPISLISEEMGLPNKAIGGLVGAMNRKLARHDIPSPLKKVRTNGERVFIWCLWDGE